MRKISRRTVLFATTALALGACTPTGIDTTTLAADETLFANALAALEPLVPPSAANVLAQIQQAETVVVGAINSVASANATSGQSLINTVTAVASAILGLFPGGGTAVEIAKAVLALIPEVAAIFGISGAVAPVGTPSAGAARTLLAALPRSPLLPAQ